ncbi:methyltransferase domain-containing protein [Dehalococcoidia bacterium]|nr:methyltransferase domain-containing protein [Dehalococcoidia bacterium]
MYLRIYDRLKNSNIVRTTFLSLASGKNNRMNVVLDLAALKQSNIVLDVGCSWGGSSYYFISLVNGIVGVDIDHDSLKDAKEVLGKNCDKFAPICADATCLPFKKETFDTVMCIEIIEHITEDRAFIKELYRVLKKDGNLVLTTPNSSVPRNRFNPAPLVPKYLKPDPSQLDAGCGQYGHVRSGYTCAEIENVLEEMGFRIEKHDYAFKRVGRIVLDLVYATKLLRFVDVLLQPISYFDKFCKGVGACHVILAKKGAFGKRQDYNE